jgi:hypothetical protein
MTRQEIQDFSNRSQMAESVEIPGELARKIAARLMETQAPTSGYRCPGCGVAELTGDPGTLCTCGACSARWRILRAL